MIAAGKIAAGKNRSRTAVSPSRRGQAQDGQRVSGKEELTEDKEDRVVPPLFLGLGRTDPKRRVSGHFGSRRFDLASGVRLGGTLWG